MKSKITEILKIKSSFAYQSTVQLTNEGMFRVESPVSPNR